MGISRLQAATVTGYRLVGEKVEENRNERRRKRGEKNMEMGRDQDDGRKLVKALFLGM